MMKQDCKKYDGCRKPVQQCNAKCSEYSPRGIDYGGCPFDEVWDCPEDYPHATCKHREITNATHEPLPKADNRKDS